MRTFSAATAPWVDAEESRRDHEIEEIRSHLWVAWRALNERVEDRLSSNGASEAVISELFEVCRGMAVLSAKDGEADSLVLLSVLMQDLIQLKERSS